MRKMLFIAALAVVAFQMTGCYDFNREQDRLDRENDGKGILMKARYEKQAKIEEAKANLQSSKLNAETRIVKEKANSQAKKIAAQGDADARLIEAESKAKAARTISESLKGNEIYLKYMMLNGMNNAKNTIYIPTEAGVPILLK